MGETERNASADNTRGTRREGSGEKTARRGILGTGNSTQVSCASEDGGKGVGVRDLAACALTVAEQEEYEERAGIIEFDGGLPRPVAEREALRIVLAKREELSHV